MARRGGIKALSVEQEDWIAARYGGRRSRSSGAADNDQGDVRATDYLIECKMTGSPAIPIKNTPKILRDMEKIAEEAWAEGKTPLLALRYFSPESLLADSDGYVDLIVKRVSDDV